MIPFLHRLPVAPTEDNPLWLIVLADMMTNLMLFFLVMYALSQQSPKAARRWPGPSTRPMSSTPSLGPR